MYSKILGAHINTRLSKWVSENINLTILHAASGQQYYIRHSMGTYQENKFMHNSSENAQPQSSQLIEPM